MEVFYRLIANQLGVSEKSIANTIQLLDEGCTVPFIARYRKEATNNLLDEQVFEVQKLTNSYRELEKRKQFILETIKNQDALTDKLEEAIVTCFDAQQLEDLYLPFKPKRANKAEKARTAGLEPLAKMMMSGFLKDPNLLAERYLNDAYDSPEKVLQGARDIIAEWISEHAYTRKHLRKLFWQQAILSSKVVKAKANETDSKFTDYFDYQEPIKKMAPHRIHAVLRAATEGLVKISVKIDAETAFQAIHHAFIGNKPVDATMLNLAIEDAYKRLLQPSLENECLTELKQKADVSAIQVFANNLKQLLLTAPIGSVRTLAIDPGFRTGCKLVCLNEQGDLLYNETIYPHPPQNQSGLAIKKIISLVNQYNIQAIAIGNGTASRETEQLIRKTRFSTDIQVYIVNENGASIYSASKVAREEFPEYDVTVRGSVSIGRRLMDPLAELVKIEPKSLGVGQYQHDVDQNLLQESLDQTVVNCVNTVGVNLNTASKHLLQYVSGLGPALAQNIVDYRSENGAFESREQLKKVPRLGAKAFEQAAGFLRIPNGVQVLDNTGVHPENYAFVEQLAKSRKLKLEDLVGNKEVLNELKTQQNKELGSFTYADILQELAKPGRDPRKKAKIFEFDRSLKTIDDLKDGATYPGIVTNITNFGAFVDIGLKQNGLVHISEICNEFISSPAEKLVLNQEVQVKVIGIDVIKQRIALSIKQA